jgi:hypothetical protein
MCGPACPLRCIPASGGPVVAMHPLVQGLLLCTVIGDVQVRSTVAGRRAPLLSDYRREMKMDQPRQARAGRAQHRSLRCFALPATGRPHLPLVVITEYLERLTFSIQHSTKGFTSQLEPAGAGPPPTDASAMRMYTPPVTALAIYVWVSVRASLHGEPHRRRS